MNFSINDQVVFVNENLKGKVTAIKNDILTIECMDLEIEVHKKEVIKINANYKNIYSKLNNTRILDVNENDSLIESNSQRFNNQLKINISRNFELDLHIEKLIENFSCLNAQEILQFQMNAFFKGIFKAKRLGINYLIVIHGIGKGVLRGKIIDFLKKNEAIYSPANYALYKGGAIEIKIN